MKKELIIAIVFGLGMGLIITYGVYTACEALKQKTGKIENDNGANKTAQPEPLASPAFNLSINEPENNLVVNKNSITVSGQTEPQSIVAVFGEEEETLAVADSEGLFSAELALIGGINEIKILANNRNNQQMEKTLTIVYSTAKIE